MVRINKTKLRTCAYAPLPPPNKKSTIVTIHRRSRAVTGSEEGEVEHEGVVVEDVDEKISATHLRSSSRC